MFKKALTSLSGALRSRSSIILVPARNISKDHLHYIKETKAQHLKFKDTKQQDKIGIGGYLLLICPLSAFGLGCWQVQRKTWKENLIKRLGEKSQTAAIPIPDNLHDVDAMEYRKIIVRGEFRHDQELLMGPRSLISHGDITSKSSLMTTKNENIGFLVVTPFKLEGREETILVNRGWVPASKKMPKTRPEGQIRGTVELEGVVRLAEPRPQFHPEHKENMYFYRDLVKMCKNTGAEPIFIDAVFNSTVDGGPIAGQTRITLRNEHLQYIITWFSLSAFTSYMWYRMVFNKIPK